MFIENTEDLAQNKLLLLYIIDKSEKPLTNEEITEFVLEKNYMNYFLIQQYLSELINSSFIEHITKEDKNVYHILDKGKATLSYFEDRIPNKTKEEITNKFIQIKKDEKKATQVLSEFFKKDDNQFMVKLKLVENDETLFSIYINVPTIKQAEKICYTWKNNTEYIYKNVLNMLVDEKITSVED
jgi:DNA-binding PadR family transcriptional regulator